MAINRVEIKNILVFTGEFTCDFCPGINVIIGGNGTGKTTLMKSVYMQHTEKKLEIMDDTVINDDILIANSIINNRFSSNGTLNNEKSEIKYYSIEGSIKDMVYIPVTEMLSHSKGFLELSYKYELPFDKMQIDILINAGLPITRKITQNAEKLIGKIKKIIDGEVLYEGGEYYILKNSGLRVDFSLEASGFQKFGLLWKLLRNGLLESGSVLFWDEPEASINPELLPVLADILLELQRGGVQVFIATHSYNLARYFDVNRNQKDNVMFYNLSKNDSGGIKCVSAQDYTNLPENILDQADEKLFKAVVANVMEVQPDE
ncbi:AAA family ATPase [Treponema primitia]|uniref:AAA family ATPase n=1 Tax=Treponema primitia TaxID=88058 RepID=UPI00397F25E0